MNHNHKKKAYEFNKRQQELYIQTLLKQKDSLAKLSPDSFEGLVTKLFQAQGYKAQKTKASGDEGKDIILKDTEQTYYAECKRYASTNKVGRPDIQKLAGAMMGDNIAKGFFVTTSSFTQEAINFSAKANIKLIDGTELALLLEQSFGGQNESQFQIMCSKCGNILSLKIPDDVMTIDFECSCEARVLNTITFTRKIQTKASNKKNSKKRKRKKTKYPT